VAEPQESRDPATAKQKAFLTFMGISFPPEIDREAAAILVNEAMENPRDAARLNRWNKERLRLHPDLFAAEIQAAKEQRAQHFYEVCEAEGTPWFTKVTKAHCQVLVGYLDVHHPSWDADPDTAATNYFFPAIAEKFPQLMTKEAKGRFKYPEGPKVAKELVNRSPVAVKARRSSPMMALARGVFFGALILGMLWFVKGVLSTGGKPGDGKVASTAASGNSATSATPGGDPATTPAGDPAAALAQNPAAENPAAPAIAGNPAEMTPGGAPVPEMTPEAPATATDPLAPAPETLPVAALPPAPPGTPLLLTKPVEIQAKFGKIKLPPGTPVKLVQQNGATLTVQVAGKDLATIPASSTNLGAEPHPTVPPAPVVPAPGSVVPTAPAPAPAGDSLFGPPTTPAAAPGTARANPSADL
jgi:hypothetical protein